MRIHLTVDLSEDHLAYIREAMDAGENPSITVQARTFDRYLAPPWKDDLLEPRWMSIESARRYTGVSEGTLRKACSLGLVRSYFVQTKGQGAGRRILDRLSIDDWIQGGRPGHEKIEEQMRQGKRLAEQRKETREQIKTNKAKWAKDPQK